MKRFPIRFDRWYGALSSALLLPPAGAWIDVDSTNVHVRMGWAFHCTFARTAIASAAQTDKRPLARGVHGVAGRWLVNGAGQGIVAIQLNPVQRAYVVRFPVRLRELMVSVDAPQALIAALTAR